MRSLSILIFALCVACAPRAPQLPVPATVREFTIPWENAFPGDLAVTADGRVWFSDRMTHVIGVFDPETGQFDRLVPPTPRSAPYGIVLGPDGAIWFAESRAGRIGRLDPATRAIAEYPVPGLEQGGGPHLLAWSGKRLWFTARDARRWGWFDPAKGTFGVHELPAPPPAKEGTAALRSIGGAFKPYGIAAAKGGGVWISTYDGPLFYRAREKRDTLKAHLLERPIQDTAFERMRVRAPDSLRARLYRPSVRVAARRIATDPRSGAVWAGDFTGRGIVRYQSPADTFTIVPFKSAGIYGIGVDQAGRVWAHPFGSNLVLLLEPKSGRIAQVQLQGTGTVRQIAFDVRRKRVWLPISDSGRLGLLQLH